MFVFTKNHPKLLLYLEITAVALNLLFTVLYIMGTAWCFPFAIIGSALFIFLCFIRGLFAETALQIFYVGFAIYGWLTFFSEGKTELWPAEQHLCFLLLGVLAWVVVSYLLRHYTTSKMPIIDTFTTVFSVMATWIMVNFDPVNWYYWIIIDAVAIYLYAARKMYVGASMFLIYLILAIIGLMTSLSP